MPEGHPRFDPARDESRTARLIVDDALQHAAGRVEPIATSDDYVTALGSRYVDFLVPGLLGMNLLGSGVWGLGFALVDLRRKRLLKRLIATPMSPALFFTSFLISRLVVLTFEVVALVGFGVLVFHVPLRGSIASLMFIAVFGALSFNGLGRSSSGRERKRSRRFPGSPMRSCSRCGCCRERSSPQVTFRM